MLHSLENTVSISFEDSKNKIKGPTHSSKLVQGNGHDSYLSSPLVLSEDGREYVKFQVTHHKWRYWALFSFLMTFLSVFLCTRFVVKPIIAKGNNSSCPPFRNRPHGFDIDTDSHLVRIFGFNNVSNFKKYLLSFFYLLIHR